MYIENERCKLNNCPIAKSESNGRWREIVIRDTNSRLFNPFHSVRREERKAVHENTALFYESILRRYQLLPEPFFDLARF